MPVTPLHEALQAFVRDDEPPMGLTSAGILQAGRRSRRNHRAAALAGAAAAAAVLTLAGMAALPSLLPASRPASTFGALAPCPAVPGSRPAGQIDPARPFTPAMAAWATASVTCALADEVPGLLPDARFLRVPGAKAGPLVGYTFNGEQPPFGNRVDAVALVRDRHGTGDLTISVGVGGARDRQAAIAACQHDPRCEVRTISPGVTALVAKYLPAAEAVVTVYRGHTLIHVEASNTDRQVVNGAAPGATRDAPVLATGQVLDLALSPQLYLFP